MKKRTVAFQQKWLKRNEGKTPVQILQEEGRKAVAVLSEIMSEGTAENNRMKSAIAIASKFFPEKAEVQHSGDIKVRWEK